MTEEYQQDGLSTRYQPLGEDFNSLRMRLDPSDDIEALRNRLLKKRFDTIRQEWINTNSRPFISEEGVDELIVIIASQLNVGNVLSNLKDHDIGLIERHKCEDTIEFIFHKHEQYNIKEDDFNTILHFVQDWIRTFLRRAAGGMTHDTISKQIGYHESVAKTDRSQQLTPKNNLNPFKRR